MSIDYDRGERTGPRRPPPASGQQAVEELLQAAPGLARIAANMARQGASEIANAYVEGASRVVRAASQGESTADAVQETTAELRAYLRELIGVEESTHSPRPTGDSSAEALRSRVQTCAEANAFFKSMQNAAIREPVTKTSADIPAVLRELLEPDWHKRLILCTAQRIENG